MEYIRGRGGVLFLEKENWKEEMVHLILKYNGKRGRYETDEEKKERIQEELEVSKRIIEEEIGQGKEVQFFAFPFGAYNDDLIEFLKKSAYRGAFTTLPGGNIKGDNPYLLKRMMILAQDSLGGLENIFKEY